MLNFFAISLLSRQYIPHGHCYLWQPSLVWLHVLGDALTALAYYSIPLTLLYFVRKRQDVPFQAVFWLFSAFILACGTSHLMEVVTLWWPVYWISGGVKLVTATVSAYTAFVLVGLIPKALALPSPAELAAANTALRQEIEQRQQIEASLRASENRFRTLLQELRVGVLVQGLNAEILISNPAAQHLLGFNEAQLHQKTSYDTDWDVIHEDGSPFPIEEHPIPQVIATQEPVRNVVMGVARPADSTEAAETADAADAAEVAKTTDETERIEPIQRDKTAIAPAEPERVWLLVDADPQFDQEGQLMQVMCSFSDITAWRQVEEERRQYTKQLQIALNSEALINRVTEKVRDSLDEQQVLQTAVDELVRVLNVDYCETRFDTDPPNFLGCDRAHSLVCDQLIQLARDVDLEQVQQQLLNSEMLQFCCQSANPILRGSILVCPIVENQQILGALWLFKRIPDGFDWSEQRLVQQVTNQCAIAIRQARLYQAAQTQVQQLERLNRLKDDFLSTVSHELRTPMTNMNMAIHMLQTAPDSRRETYLKILQTECKREIELINSLLDLQRLEAETYVINTEEVNLQAWLPQLVLPLMDRFEQQQQQFHLDLMPDLPSIITDVTSLERILLELLNNACKYTPKLGQIHLQVQTTVPQFATVGQRRDVPPSSMAAADRIVFTVANQADIPAAELPHLFDKFYRVPNADPWKQGGTGLGLALVRGLVQHLGGSIDIDSQDGWTTATVALPRRLTV